MTGHTSQTDINGPHSVSITSNGRDAGLDVASNGFPRSSGSMSTRPAFCARFAGAIRRIAPRDVYLPTESDYEDGAQYARATRAAGVRAATINTIGRLMDGAYTCEFGVDREPTTFENVVLQVARFRRPIDASLLASFDPSLREGHSLAGVGDWARAFGEHELEAGARRYTIQIVDWSKAPTMVIKASARRVITALPG
jgi:hypothetical protein